MILLLFVMPLFLSLLLAGIALRRLPVPGALPGPAAPPPPPSLPQYVFYNTLYPEDESEDVAATQAVIDAHLARVFTDREPNGLDQYFAAQDTERAWSSLYE